MGILDHKVIQSFFTKLHKVWFLLSKIINRINKNYVIYKYIWIYQTLFKNKIFVILIKFIYDMFS